MSWYFDHREKTTEELEDMIKMYKPGVDESGADRVPASPPHRGSESPDLSPVRPRGGR